MSKSIDAKFVGVIQRVKDGKLVEPGSYVVFLGRDNLLPELLKEYERLCVVHGCDERQIDAVLRMRERLRQWREDNSSALKLPDVDNGEALNE